MYVVYAQNRLIQIARDLLAIPCTSAASERVFKTADDVITHDRNRLKPDHASRLIFMKQALKNVGKTVYELCCETKFSVCDEIGQAESDSDEDIDAMEVMANTIGIIDDSHLMIESDDE